MHLRDGLPRPCGPRNDESLNSHPGPGDDKSLNRHREAAKQPRRSPVQEAAQALASGHLVAFPTETVYGLGADGLNPQAVEKIFKAKGRPADHPVILHVADIEHARALASKWPAAAQQLADQFWPGPLTLILKRAPHVTDIVTGGQDTVGIRIPSHALALALLNEFSRLGSGVIAAPSANRFGGVSPTRARDVALSLGDRLSQQDMILDGGDCEVGVESTIVDLSREAPQILRPGGVSREALERALGYSLAGQERLQINAPSNAPRVSGALASHYAPRTRARLLNLQALVHEGNDRLVHDPKTRIIAVCIHEPQGLDPRIAMRRMPTNAQAYAKLLYATLNDLDQQGADLLLIEHPPESVQWEAVRDRLRRACD
jgi:L-threonylcarbamoyladenylate synthase